METTNNNNNYNNHNVNNNKNSKVASRPIGIRLFGSCYQFNSTRTKRLYYKALVLLLTFITYAVFHMGRRPLSIVMNVLNRNCSALHINHAHDGASLLVTPSIAQTTTPSSFFSSSTGSKNSTRDLSDNSCNWAPFDDEATANRLMAILDTAFLVTYALVMFVSGIIAERMNLRHLVSIGSLITGIGLIAFGLSYPLDIHSMTYYTAIQIITGAAQSVGWPVVVTCVSNWFEPAKSGLIYGLWNSHLNLGNIMGATIAGYFVEKDWGLSFMVPGVILILTGFLQFFFLCPTPEDVGLQTVKRKNYHDKNNNSPPINNTTTLEPFVSNSKDGNSTKINEMATFASEQDQSEDSENNSKPVSFWTALMIPGVIEYSLCLLFAKLVSYTFLFWLPRYIASSTKKNSELSAYLSTPFDFGGVFGSILAGYLSDRYNTNGIICNVMLALAIPGVFVYHSYGSYSNLSNIVLQLLVGMLINGPYCLITTVVSADLGTRVKNGKAMSTVVAIVDGMGSIGSVLGPLFAGFISGSFGWRAVFIMLMISDVLASLCLVRVTIGEIKQKFCKQKSTPTATMTTISDY